MNLTSLLNSKAVSMRLVATCMYCGLKKLYEGFHKLAQVKRRLN